MTWMPENPCIEQEMKIAHTEKEPLFFNHYNPDATHAILDTRTASWWAANIK